MWFIFFFFRLGGEVTIAGSAGAKALSPSVPDWFHVFMAFDVGLLPGCGRGGVPCALCNSASMFRFILPVLKLRLHPNKLGDRGKSKPSRESKLPTCAGTPPYLNLGKRFRAQGTEIRSS